MLILHSFFVCRLRAQKAGERQKLALLVLHAKSFTIVRAAKNTVVPDKHKKTLFLNA